MTISSLRSHAETGLHRSGYSVRIVRAPEALLEIYSGDRLVDAVWAGSPVCPLLRGAVRGRRTDVRWALAWGQVPVECDVAVVFASGQDPVQPVRPMIIAGAFWVAEAGGDFGSVSVAAGPDRATGRLIEER